MKSVEARIAYYTKKVAQYGEIHLSKRRNPYRLGRLMAYKKAIHETIEKEKTPTAMDVSKHLNI